jgi:hypothetical protein
MNESERFNNGSLNRSANPEPYEPPESLWQLIKSVANERELDTIKSIIGESLIENSIDLHNEIDSLLEIWRDYRNETNVTLNQIDLKNSKNLSLPEPPNIRETLKKEINFFVKQMREQYKEDDHFRRQISANNHNLNVINYVLNTALTKSEFQKNFSNPVRSRSTSERPVSVVNNTGNETPVIFNSSEGVGRQSRQRVRYRSISRSSSLSCSSSRNQVKSVISNYGDINVPGTLSENIESYVDEDKINCMQIDEIADHLRELLQQECDTLLKDIEFLYECIDQEREYRDSSKQSIYHEPSLNELKEERKRLETDIMSATSRNQAKISKLPLTVSSQGNNRSINSPLVRPTPSPPGSASSTKSKISIISTNDINLKDRSVSKGRSPSLKQSELKTSNSIKTTTIQKAPIITTTTSNNNNSSIKRSSSINNTPKMVSKPNTIKNQTNFLNNGLDKLDFKPSLSRSNSVSSIASSVASSMSSSTSSKLSAVQKFRQMVLDNRD